MITGAFIFFHICLALITTILTGIFNLPVNFEEQKKKKNQNERVACVLITYV